MLLLLAKCLASIEADESCHTIIPEYTQRVLKVYELGKSGFTGPHMTYLILVVPNVILLERSDECDLIGEE
jgi:hypothetical protein